MPHLNTRSRVLYIGLIAAAAIPHPALAASGILEQIVPTGSCICPGSAPDYGCIIQLIQNVINDAIAFGIILCVVWIAYGGFSLMISGGSPQARSAAKTRLLNALIGIAVILCSWIIVDSVMKVVYNPDTAFQGGPKFGPWNSILAPDGQDFCLVTNANPQSIVSGTVSVNTSSTSGGTGTPTYSVGEASGNCSADAIAQDWGGNTEKGQLFSCIINNESKCQNISTQIKNSNSSAGGRYQVLMSTNGLNFPACVAVARQNGFTDATFNCGAHYPKGYSDGSAAAQACRTAQLDPTCNTQAAQYLYNNGGISHWLGRGDVGGKNQSCVTQYGT